MTAAFFVYTPFQFLIAQQILLQEKFEKAILIQGYVGDNTQFLDVYEALIIKQLWGDEYVFPELPRWDGLRIQNLHDILKAYKNYKTLKNILHDNNVDILFLGEHQNQALRFSAKVFANEGYKIAFFEEGLAHYVNGVYKTNNSLISKCKILLRDLFYYIPIYHIRFANWRYNINMPIENGIPYNYRFSFLPIYKGEKEKQITFTRQFSKKTTSLLDKTVNNIGSGKKVLLLSQPLDEIYSDVSDFINIYCKVLTNALLDCIEETTICVKFHPRDKDATKNAICNTLEKMELKYIVISDDINLPVELFLQCVHFDKILFFCTSTFVYNGYLFPKQNFVCLLPALNEACVEKSSHQYETYNNIMSFYDNLERLKTNTND